MAETNIDFDDCINRKGTRSLKYDFAKSHGKPEDVLPMWVADMDFKTSSYIVDALKEAIGHGIYGYSDTDEKYFEIVKQWMNKHHGWNVEESWLIKTPGIVFAISTAIRAFTEVGDNVLIQQPVYYPFSEVILQNKRHVINNALVNKDGHYEIDFDDFEKKIIDNKVKLFILCSPHNPVGRVWSEEELTRLGEICLRNRVIVVSDEIHSDFVFKGRHKVFADIKESFADISVICTSPSKTFNLAGLQVSNIFIKDYKLRQRFKQALDSTGYCEISLPGIVACETAYSKGEEWYEALLEYIRGNIEYTKQFISENIPKIKLAEQEGLYLVWLDFREFGLSDDEINRILVNEAKVWFDPGRMFGT
ncbi:MAG: pyridoxal phosphate-dependent aminotransferase, partial [Lachnospiraceae bacterium]|nr:pyridoxal phosphate-dependent aminotransferase [Lachnospiraceae bacterium]